MNSSPPSGAMDRREEQISSRVFPMTSVWSMRTLVMTARSACSICWEARCSSGVMAMHSHTSTSAFSRKAVRSMYSCSRMLDGARRSISSSRPSACKSSGSVPVDFAATRRPPALSPAVISLTVEDLPRMPFTWMTWRSERLYRRAQAFSAPR